MLMIRSEQMKAFELDRISQFKARLRARLVERLGPGADVQREIERGLAEAQRFGFSSERDIAQFIEITCVELGCFPEGQLPRAALAILMTHGQRTSIKLNRYELWARKTAAAGEKSGVKPSA